MPLFVEDKHKQKRHIAERDMAVTAQERKKTNAEDNGTSTQGPEHHPLVPSQYKRGGPRSRDSQGVVWWWREKSLFWVSNHNLFQEKCLVGMAFYPKEVVDDQDHPMHAIEVRSERPEPLSIEARGEMQEEDQTKKEFVMAWVVEERECTGFTQWW